MTIPATENLIGFALAAAVVVAVPGPNHFYVASRALLAGRRSGVAAAIGIEVGTTFHIALAAIGLSQVVASSPVAMRALTMTGAGYLLFLAYRALRHSSKGPGRNGGTPPSSVTREIFRAAAVNILNPKVILFFIAFLTPFLDQRRGDIPSQVLSFGAIVVVLGTISNLIYALAASTMSRRTVRSAKSQTFVARLQATIYVVMALVALGSTLGA